MERDRERMIERARDTEGKKERKRDKREEREEMESENVSER